MDGVVWNAVTLMLTFMLLVSKTVANFMVHHFLKMVLVGRVSFQMYVDRSGIVIAYLGY